MHSGYLERFERREFTVSSLCLGYGNLRDADAARLARVIPLHSSLTSLDLSFNEIKGNGAKILSEYLSLPAATIVELNLKHNKLGSAGASHLCSALKTNSNLLCLNLNSNGISEKGTRKLAKVLAVNHTLQHLDLGFNQIFFPTPRHEIITLSPNGKFWRQRSVALLKSSQKRCMKIPIGDRDAYLTRTKSSEISPKDFDRGASNIYSLFVEGLTRNTSLLSLNLERNNFGENPRFVGAISAFLRGNTCLTALDISDNDFSTVSMGRLSE